MLQICVIIFEAEKGVLNLGGGFQNVFLFTKKNSLGDDSLIIIPSPHGNHEHAIYIYIYTPLC